MINRQNVNKSQSHFEQIIYPVSQITIDYQRLLFEDQYKFLHKNIDNKMIQKIMTT